MLCEPQWKGLIHASFNAALLASIRAGMPGRRIVFLADPSHGEEVRAVLRAAGHMTDDVEWRDLQVDYAQDWNRKEQSNPIWRLRGVVRAIGAEVAILASATALQIAVAKVALGLLAPGCRTLVFLHENAEVALGGGLGDSGAWRGALRASWNRARWPHGMAFAVFGARVLRELSRDISLARCVPVGALRPPYFLEEPPSDEEIAKRWAAKQIVFIGNTYKGRFEEFLGVARAIQQRHPGTQFTLAGGLSAKDPAVVAQAVGIFGETVTTEMLSREEFLHRLRQGTFGVVHVAAENYRARISAGTLDSLSACLPSAFRSMPFNDSCVEDDGVPALLYRDADGLERSLRVFLEETSLEDYRHMVSSLVNARTRFCPAVVGREFRGLLEDALGIDGRE